MASEPERLGSRLLDICVGLLLAAMALAGAVMVIRAIWVPLCITLFVVVAIAGGIWVFTMRSRRW